MNELSAFVELAPSIIWVDARDTALLRPAERYKLKDCIGANRHQGRMNMANDEYDDSGVDYFDELDVPCDDATDFDRVAKRAVSRRSFLEGAAMFGASAFVSAAGILTPTRAPAAGHLPFSPVAANGLDTVTVPTGYRWYRVISWGDPLWSTGARFDHATRGTGASQELAFGDNNDGMATFEPEGHVLLAVNNEYVNRAIIYANRASRRPQTADDVRKGKAGHGVSIFEVVQRHGRWVALVDSKYNRRVTADTPMEITGPARGHAWLKTAADPSGTQSLGTWNNCANGRTPWGTYLTCEENFNGYFSSSDESFVPTPAMQRYGLGLKDWGYNWRSTDARFDISKHPNEPNRVGYVVEIDPANPSSTPRKRTALGRFKHENAAVVVAENGHVVVYLGDDERGEFLYRFVSAGKFSKVGDNTNLLEDGRLYAAKFEDSGRGQWLELTPQSTGLESQAQVCIHTRIAASAVKATTMDRPEWVAVNPLKPEVYCALSNNKNRGRKPNAGGDPTPVAGPNPRGRNRYGQVVRWRPDRGDHTAPGLQWDLYVVAGNPLVHEDARAGSSNVNLANMFNSPDGIGFDSKGGLWIQTDGNYSNAGNYAGQGNNQMLYGNTDTGEIQRFLVGPKECEVTGLTWSPDRKTMFVGIQHPGDRGGSHFPGGGDSTPRSSVIAVEREDGREIG
jgi:uncharacterized protein